jgi:nicotinate-nucleotide adenylyltransferase
MTGSRANGPSVLLFGGSFNPPHIGHLSMAALALEQTFASEVWWLPAPAPPHKTKRGDMHSFADRCAMVEALIQTHVGMRMMPLEAQLPTPSYTVDTIRACQSWFPDIEFQFLIGSDSLSQLPTWHGALELATMVSFVVATRTGFPFPEEYAHVKSQLPDLCAHQIQMPLLDVESSWLRLRMDKQLSTFGLVPETVLDIWEGIPRIEVEDWE